MKKTLIETYQLADYLTEFSLRVQTHNNIGLFDVNRLSEGFCAKILNIIFYKEKLTLGNLNLLRVNYPAIDLGDTNAKVAYQVTSQNDVQKITETLDKFIETDDFKNGIYTDLRFLILNGIHWTGRKRSNIKKKFSSNKLTYTEGKQIVSLQELQKQIRFLDEPNLDALTKLLEAEFGKREINTLKSFDLNVFFEFNKILDEDTMTNMYQGLYSGTPYDCVELTDEIINPYTLHASKTTGQFLNSELQTAHEHFIRSINKLRSFLLMNYVSERTMEHLTVPEFASGFERLLAKDKLVEILNKILDETLTKYRDYRKIIKEQYYV